MKKIISLVCFMAVILIMSISVFANEYVVTNNGKQLFFAKGIVAENDTVYLPLEELLDKLGITKSSDNYYLHIENNRFSLYIAGGSNDDIYNMEIGKKQIVYTQSPKTVAPATRDTIYAPILRNDLIYIPFEYIDYIFNSPFDDTGLYHIELKNGVEQVNNSETHDDNANMASATANTYNGWAAGSVVFVVLFVIGYIAVKKIINKFV